MNRREFLVKGCTACMATVGVSSLLNSCAPTQYISGTLGKDGLTISKDEFKLNQKSNTAYRSFVIIRNDALQYPICVYRFSDEQYSALWMKCTHQGTELNASGDFLQCPAHGSEFNNKGMVKTGPADKNLRIFPVTVLPNELFIDLRKQS
ncbi:MAG TPA: Rieske (2Fe-2S) protein [Chitinophagaceae bacterium]|jgi:Rieske Fe-S protein|nr:Rieske (2Fe-2S) protein [Chitinophagaceae bacterium]